jgi:hypothetical protein
MKKNPMFGAVLMMALAAGNTFDHSPFYRREHGHSTKMRYSSHNRHQGDREKARRVRQIQDGTYDRDQVIRR